MKKQTTKESTDRRAFIKQGTGAILAASLANTFVGSALLSSCTPKKIVANSSSIDADKFATSFQQTPLPYAYDALEPMIDKETMEIHYTKHAAAYARNFTDAVREEHVEGNKSVEDILKEISRYSAKMRNNAGGHYNHELFWKLMSPSPKALVDGPLWEAITIQFGSIEGFKSVFEAQAKQRFGSGWAWLIYSQGKLVVASTPNQDNPLMNLSDFKGFPLIGLDVWEHAYYLAYQNRRPDYITNWWKVLDWELVEKRFDFAVKSGKY